MNSTSPLIESLAAGLQPMPFGDPAGRLARGVVAGGAVTLGAILAAYGVQPDLAGAALPAMAMKDGYVLGLAALAAVGVLSLGRPDAARPRHGLLLIPVAMLALIAGIALVRAPDGTIGPLLLGGSWRQCPARIALLSLPILAGVLATLRQRAPTRLRRAGAAAGLLAGCVAAALYALACTESSAAFVLIWYSAGIALATAIGALVGPRALRW